MKKIILAAAFYLISTCCGAQFNTTLVVSPQPPGAILNWGVKELTYLITNQTGANRRAVIKATFKLTDGTVIGSTNLAKSRVITIGGGNTVLYATDVIPGDVMIFSGKYKISIDKTGKLPADNYQLCVQLVTPVDFLPVSEERCRIFFLAAYQLPIPIIPANEDVLEAVKAQTAITFRWTPVAPRPVEAVKYIVTVFEVLDKQTPLQALRSNQPLLSKEVIGTTQYIWQPQLSFADSSPSVDSIAVKRFIWTLQTTNSNGTPFGDGNINADGISEPNTFIIISDQRKNKTGPPARVIYLNNSKRF